MLEKLKHMWLAPFRLIGVVVGISISNRNYFHKIKEQSLISRVVRYGALLTIVAWLVISLLATSEERSRLSESVKHLWSEAWDGTSSPEQLKQR